MISNRSSGAEDDSSSGTRLRKLTKKKSDDRPKVVRLGTKGKSSDDAAQKKGVRRLGTKGGDGTDAGRLSDSIQGSDSERSEASMLSTADEWNTRPVTRIAEEQTWNTSDSGEWEKVNIEPPFVKKHAYKCGPVTDEEEPTTFPRLQAGGVTPSPQRVEEKTAQTAKPPQQQAEPPRQPSPDRELTLDEKFPEPPQVKQSPKPQSSPGGGWSLRNSWLGSVSKSVASLTTHLTQNVSSALESPKDDTQIKEEFKALIAERINQLEEKPKTGRKYLHKAGIDETFTQGTSRSFQGTHREDIEEDKSNVKTSAEDEVLQQSAGLVTSGRPAAPIKSKSSSLQTAAFLQQEAASSLSYASVAAKPPSKPAPQLKTPQKESMQSLQPPQASTEDAWDDWSDDFGPSEPAGKPPRAKVEKTSTSKVQKLGDARQKEASTKGTTPATDLTQNLSTLQPSSKDEKPEVQAEVLQVAEVQPEVIVRQKREVQQAAPSPVVEDNQRQESKRAPSVGLNVEIAQQDSSNIEVADSWNDWDEDMDAAVEFVESKMQETKAAPSVDPIPPPSVVEPPPPTDPSNIDAADSWNDWDQEMEVEATEIVLETPVTQMHISAQSTTPPRTVDDEVVHGAPKFVIQNLIEETLDETLDDPAQIQLLPEEEKRELERKIQDSLHLEVSKYYDQDSTHEWDEDEEVDWGGSDSPIPAMMQQPTAASVEETAPEEVREVEVDSRPLALLPAPQNLDASSESIESETQDAPIPYQTLEEESADDDGWGDGWGDEDEPELNLEEVTAKAAQAITAPIQASTDDRDLPPPLSPSAKAELERKLKMSLASEADKFFQLEPRAESFDWGAKWDDDGTANFTAQNVPLIHDSQLPARQVILEGFADEEDVLADIEKDIIQCDDVNVPCKVSTDDVRDVVVVDDRTKRQADSRSNEALEEPKVEETEVDMVEPVIVKKFAYKCGEDEEEDPKEEAETPSLDVNVSQTEALESVIQPSSFTQAESAPQSGWDDWSEPDQESGDDHEPQSSEEDALEPVPEPRRQSKQKSVEECIQLLIENRQKLAQKLEEHQRQRAEEGTEETLDAVQDSLNEGNRQADHLESLHYVGSVGKDSGGDVEEPTIEVKLAQQPQSQISFDWSSELEEVTAAPQNLLHFDQNIKMIPHESIGIEIEPDFMAPYELSAPSGIEIQPEVMVPSGGEVEPEVAPFTSLERSSEKFVEQADEQPALEQSLRKLSVEKHQDPQETSSSASTVPASEILEPQPSSSNVAPTDSPDEAAAGPLNEAQVYALSNALNEAASIFELPQDSDVDVPNITKITWNYIEGEEPIVIESEDSTIPLTESERKLQDYFFQGSSFADWVQGKAIIPTPLDDTEKQEQSVAYLVQTVEPTASAPTHNRVTDEWQSWEDDEEELNLTWLKKSVPSMANQVVIPVPLLQEDEEQWPAPPIAPETAAQASHVQESTAKQETIEHKKGPWGEDQAQPLGDIQPQPLSETHLKREETQGRELHFRNPEVRSSFSVHPEAETDAWSLPEVARAIDTRRDEDILLDIESQIDSVPQSFEAAKIEVAAPAGNNDSEPEAIKKFAYKCGEDEDEDTPQIAGPADFSKLRQELGDHDGQEVSISPTTVSTHQSAPMASLSTRLEPIGAEPDQPPLISSILPPSIGERGELIGSELTPEVRSSALERKVSDQELKQVVEEKIQAVEEVVEAAQVSRLQTSQFTPQLKQLDPSSLVFDVPEDAWNDWEDPRALEVEPGQTPLHEQVFPKEKEREVPSADPESGWDGWQEQDPSELAPGLPPKQGSAFAPKPIFEEEDDEVQLDAQKAAEPEDAWDDWEESESFETKSRDGDEPHQPDTFIESQTFHQMPPKEVRSAEMLEPHQEEDEDESESDDKVKAEQKIVEKLFEEPRDVSADATEEDSWGDWGEGNEASAALDSKQQLQPALSLVSAVADADDGEGWDDWGEVEVNESDNVPETSATAPQSKQQGWGDFDDNAEPVIEESFVSKSASSQLQAAPAPPQAAALPQAAPMPEPAPEQAVTNVFDRLEKKNQWNWKSNWGVSLLANASKNVASLTAQVSQNLTNALDAGLVPAPEEMAKIVKSEERTRELGRQNSAESRQRKDSQSSSRSRNDSQGSSRGRKDSFEAAGPTERRNSGGSRGAGEPRERKESFKESRERKESFKEPLHPSEVEPKLPKRKISSDSLKVSDKESDRSRKSSVASSLKSGGDFKEAEEAQDEGWEDEPWGEAQEEVSQVAPLQPISEPAPSRINSLKSLTSKKMIGLDNLMSGVTQIGSKVITGGLDTLEGIGKKTFTIIQENDAGIINKTKQFVLDQDRKEVLSDILNEAKIENADPEPRQRQKLVNFENLFDDYQGLVHLEALQILAKQSEIKIDMLLAPLEGVAYEKIKGTIDEVGELCELPEWSEVENSGDHSVAQLEDRMIFAVRDLEVEIRLDDLAATWKQALLYLNRQAPKADTKELYEKALDELAKFTALAIGKMHRLAELLSVCEYHSTATEVDALSSLLTTFCWHISGIATRFNKALNQKDKSEEISTYITNVFLEASNANTFIKQAYSLFKPILQIGAA